MKHKLFHFCRWRDLYPGFTVRVLGFGFYIVFLGRRGRHL